MQSCRTCPTGQHRLGMAFAMQGLTRLHENTTRTALSPFAVLNTLQHTCGMQCRPAVDVYRGQSLCRHAHSVPGRKRHKNLAQALDKALCTRRASTVCRAQAAVADPVVTGQPQREAIPNAESKQPPAKSSAYPFEQLEAKWQSYWSKHKTFRTPSMKELDKSKPKFYALDMFPYPRSECVFCPFGACIAPIMELAQTTHVCHAVGLACMLGTQKVIQQQTSWPATNA